MGRRPTPNPRRGILRAIITVVVLTALLVIAILVVSSLTAPSVKAPSNLPTPGPITPIATPAKTAPATTPHAVPSPTKQKKVLGSLLQNRPAVPALERVPSVAMLEYASARKLTGIAVQSHDRVAWFSPSKHGTPFAPLHVLNLLQGSQFTIGPADSLVKPVWSTNGRYLLYVARTRSLSEGTLWTLWQYDANTRFRSRLAALPGIAMTPLGWWRGNPLFLVASTSDTSIYTVEAGRSHFFDVLAPQVITSAVLSPRAPLIAFVAPTNCYNCTLELFSLSTHDAWSGPSDIANESLLAWTNDGHHVLTVVNNRIVLVASAIGSRPQLVGALSLPKQWFHSMSVSIQHGGVSVLDRVTGHSVVGDLRSGTL